MQTINKWVNDGEKTNTNIQIPKHKYTKTILKHKYTKTKSFPGRRRPTYEFQSSFKKVYSVSLIDDK